VPVTALFMPDWYARTYPEVAATGLDPYTHFRLQGQHEGRRPNPLFQPTWYARTNADVKGIADPLSHYERAGWREGRDPGPSFSVSYYLATHPALAKNGEEPLAHYLATGQPSGHAPHPLLSAVDLAQPHVRLVMASSGNVEACASTLASLAEAKPSALFDVVLVGDGAVSAVGAGGDLPLRTLDGLSDLRQVLDGPITHLALLAPGVLTPAGWLDALLDTTEPVVGPVSDGAWTQQAVPVEADVTTDCAGYAARRSEAFGPGVRYGASLDASCILLRRDVVDRVGLHDAGFAPGTIADADYGLRLIGVGYRPAVARGIFVHVPNRSTQADEAGDLRRFLEKHGHPPAIRSHLRAVSWAEDLVSRRPVIPGSGAWAFQAWTFEAHAATVLMQAEAEAERAEAALADARSEATAIATRKWHDERRRLLALTLAQDDELAALLTAREERIFRLEGEAALEHRVAAAREAVSRPILFGGVPNDVSQLGDAARLLYARLLRGFWEELQDRDMLSFVALAGAQHLLQTVAEAVDERGGTLVFCDADPVTCDPADGYAQRILAVDGLIASTTRFYVRYDESQRGRPALSLVAPATFVLWLDDADALGGAILAAVARVTKIYIHSVLAVGMEQSRRTAVRFASRVMLDLHGAVPEEFRMYDDPFRAQVFRSYERALCPAVAKLVCVTEAMAQHIGKRYGPPQSPTVVCPIFVSRTQAAGRARGRAEHLKPRVVYAGGLQRWQEVPAMLDLIVATADTLDYFVLTRDTAPIARGFAERGFDPERNGVVIRSATQGEVLALLADVDFGLVLRARSVVNAVSCPTKLVEYLENGVIPVFDSIEIGDFVALGIKYVTLVDLRAGLVPDRARRQEMIANNEAVLGRLRAISERGQREIREWIATARSRAARA